MSKGTEFRKLLATEPYVYTSGVYSPIEAKIAESVGLKCVYMSGYSCAVGYLGRADLGFPTMTEMSGWARMITSVIDVPVIADADDAYGNAMITTRTVEEFEKTGVAGIHIEDQRFPKRCGHLAGKYCLPIEESTMKIKAALDSRSDPDFVIIARTDAISAVGGGMDEAIERGKRYADVGADIVWPEFPTPDRRDLRRGDGEVLLRPADGVQLLVFVQMDGGGEPADLRGAGRDGLQVHLHHARSHPRRHVWRVELLAGPGEEPGGGPVQATVSEERASDREPPRDGRGALLGDRGVRRTGIQRQGSALVRANL